MGKLDSEELARRTVCTAYATNARPQLIRVLLVDSRPIMLDGLSELLDQHRSQLEAVACVSSYGGALAVAQKLRPHVVLLSLFHDEISALDAILALGRLSRVLVLKGMHDPLPVSTILGLGAAGVVIAEQPADAIADAIMQASGTATQAATWTHAAPDLQPAELQPRHVPAPLAQLTARERQLIRAIVAHPGAKYLVIAAQLAISEHTVHNHLSKIYQKLGLVNRNDLIMYAVRNGLDEDQPATGGAEVVSPSDARAAARRGSSRPLPG